MPIEIRELVIKASVGETEEASTPTASAGGGEQDIEKMVTLCVEKVLRVLKEKMER